MRQYDFDFKQYDIGGYNAIAGDGKLTGDEVKKAKKDGYNVWDGYTSKDPIPANEKKVKAEQEEKARVEKKAFKFEEFDIGGNDAIAGDGKLTGDEVNRARIAGYDVDYVGLHDGFSSDKSNLVTESVDVGTPIGTIARNTARHTSNKFLIGTAQALDLLVMPVTAPISLIQRLLRD